MKLFILTLFALVFILPCRSMSAPGGNAHIYDAYYGLYRVAPDHVVGIDRFINDDGESTMLFSDYQSGIVRRLFPLSDTEFEMGPNFNVESPAELTVKFLQDEQVAVTGIALKPKDVGESIATRIPLTEEAISFQDDDVRLAGTLITPVGKGPHAAIVLLHGSGPLTRYSFGPYPHFFASLGFAVLVYDKRGTGASTGIRLDASTGTLMAPGYYPDDLIKDALAALRFLQTRDDVNKKRIGFWGSSEGGMLATQVAARSRDVAFAINSSGFMGELWQTTLYQAESYPRHYGSPEREIKDSVAFTKQWLDVARTGEGWDSFISRREEIYQENKNLLSWSSGDFTSLQQIRWYWNHVLSFNALPALKNVTCPVLGVFGQLDISTEASVASENMQRALTEAGNKDVTMKIFPNAGHSLSVPSGDRMAPDVFDALRSWLIMRVHLNEFKGG